MAEASSTFPVENSAGIQSSKTEDINVDHVNHIEVDESQQLGHLANQEDHETGRFAALKMYPGACAWCIYACWSIILVSFEQQAAGSVLGIPEFRKDFGSEFDGNYVLPAKWQSAFNAAPVAS
jgi:SP family general alpha glucoside:H+ symporter-like MFS transporter